MTRKISVDFMKQLQADRGYFIAREISFHSEQSGKDRRNQARVLYNEGLASALFAKASKEKVFPLPEVK